jgi:DNA polymerase-3 subunit alpha
MEALAMAGAFDSFPSSHRAQYFHRENENDSNFLEKVIQHANQFQERKASSQNSLFGENTEMEIKDMPLPECAPWSKQEQVKHEKEVTGFYISGHPLDQHKREISEFCTATLEDLDIRIIAFKGKSVTVAGMVSTVEQRTSKSGNVFGSFILEDYTGSFRFTLFPEDYLRYKHFLLDNQLLLVKGRIEPSRMNPNRMEFKITSMNLLAESIDKFVTGIQITLKINDIDDDLIRRLPKIFKKYPGKAAIEIKVTDSEDKLTLNLLSRKTKVNPSEFLREMEAFPDVKLSLRHPS